MPRVAIPSSAPPEYLSSVREAGAEPLVLDLPTRRPRGIALRREWVADWTEISLLGEDPSRSPGALLICGSEPAELAGLMIAALRLDLPAVVAPPFTSPFAGALAALGFASFEEDPVEVAVGMARGDDPRSGGLVDDFSLAKALRAGLALGGGPELLVHLAGIASKAGATGFSKTIRVLVPENPKIVDVDSSWFEAHGVAGLLVHLRDTLHEVTGSLEENPPPPEANDGSRLVFVRGRSSGFEVVCRTDGTTTEISGHCRFFGSEEAAVSAVEDGDAIEPSDLLVVGGCGPRGGPGLLRLDRLGRALDETGVTVPVLTDGLPPENTVGPWASLATPEAVVGGVLWKLGDGDFLRLDLEQGLIRTGARADKPSQKREPFTVLLPSGSGYAARYARAALPALEGAGFG